MEEKNFDKNFRQSAEKIREQLQKELPVLEQNLESLRKLNTFMILPNVVHNICVSLERQAYKFISPAVRLWRAVDCSDMIDELAKMTNKTIEILQGLNEKEMGLYMQQYEQMKKQEEYAKEHKEHFDLEAELAVFNHVEGDMSSFYKKLLMLVVAGQMSLNEEQMGVLNEVRELCVVILENAVEQKKQALKNTEMILNNKQA